MASRTIFYTQNSLMDTATLTSLTGTATNLDFLLNYRYQSKMLVHTLSGSAYAYEVDLGSGNTMQSQYFIWINHNFYTVGSLDIEVYTKTTDTAIGTYDVSPSATFTVSLSTYEPIFVAGFSIAAAKRFFKFKLITTPVADSTYCANFFMNTTTEVFQPSRSPNPAQNISISRRGTVVNEASGGSKFAIQKQGARKVWRLKWETITDADLTILKNFESAVGGTRKPFVFTIDNNTTYYYGRLAGDFIYSVGVDSDLNDVEILIEEEI